MTELKITQADRDAAAAYYYSAGGSPKIANEMGIIYLTSETG